MRRHKPSPERRPLEQVLRELDALFQGVLPEWSALWSKCHRHIRRKLRRPPGWADADWNERVLTEAAEAAYYAKREFDPRRGPTLGQFVYWRIRQAVLRFYRQQWKYGKRFSDILIDAVLEARDDLPSHDDLESVREAVGRLPENFREVYRLLYVEGLTQAAAAKRLGISQRAVSKRNRAMLQQLRHEFGTTE